MTHHASTLLKIHQALMPEGFSNDVASLFMTVLATMMLVVSISLLIGMNSFYNYEPLSVLNSILAAISFIIGLFLFIFSSSSYPITYTYGSGGSGETTETTYLSLRTIHTLEWYLLSFISMACIFLSTIMSMVSCNYARLFTLIFLALQTCFTFILASLTFFYMHKIYKFELAMGTISIQDGKFETQQTTNIDFEFGIAVIFFISCLLSFFAFYLKYFSHPYLPVSQIQPTITIPTPPTRRTTERARTIFRMGRRTS